MSIHARWRIARRASAVLAAALLGSVFAAGIAHATIVTSGYDTSNGTGTIGPAAPGDPITRAQIIARAQDWVNNQIPYSQTEGWEDSATGGPYRMDCSGFISMAWGLPTSMVTSTLPQVATVTDGDISGDTNLNPGDALDYTADHAVLFDHWTDSSGDFAYDAEHTFGQVTNQSTDSVYSSTLEGYPISYFEALEYNNLTAVAAATSPSIAAVAGSGYVEAFQSNSGVLWNRTESGVEASTGLGMMAGTSPSITGLAGGGYVEAWQNPQGYLCNRLETGTYACTNLQMAPGTSPSIAGTTDGGYTEAFQASTGILWNRNNNGTAATTSLGMDSSSSPSITPLAGGGYVEAFQNPQHDLCNRLETGTAACTSLGMMPGTSPSIAGTTDGGYTEAFQASTGILWNRNNNGTAASTGLGMM